MTSRPATTSSYFIPPHVQKVLVLRNFHLSVSEHFISEIFYLSCLETCISRAQKCSLLASCLSLVRRNATDNVLRIFYPSCSENFISCALKKKRRELLQNVTWQQWCPSHHSRFRGRKGKNCTNLVLLLDFWKFLGQSLQWLPEKFQCIVKVINLVTFVKDSCHSYSKSISMLWAKV